MGEIVLLLAGWYGQTGWDGGGMEVPTLKGTEGAPPFYLKVRRATGSSGRWREAVDATNCVGAARARIICVSASA